MGPVDVRQTRNIGDAEGNWGPKAGEQGKAASIEDFGALSGEADLGTQADVEDSDSADERDYRDGMSSFRRKEGPFMDFIDEVSADVSQYLQLLEVGQRGRVYNRQSTDEFSRWRACMQQVHLQANQKAEEILANIQEASSLPPTGGCGSRSGGGSKAGPARKTLIEALGPCRPPTDAPFQDPPTLPDGKQRLTFSACFESGNLAVAESDHPSHYTLYIENDVNTSGYTQWFYFGVRGGRQAQRVTFRLVNLKKAGSLFEEGMRPVV